MENKYLLAEFDDCYALLSTQEEVAVGGFMADTNKIYEVPDIDGFIGFLKVIACTIPKGDLPLIEKRQIFIPNTVVNKKAVFVKVEETETGTLKVRNGFINLIGTYTR